MNGSQRAFSFLPLLHGSAVFTPQVTGRCAFYCLGKHTSIACAVTLVQLALGQSILVPALQSALVHTRYQICVESLEWQVAMSVYALPLGSLLVQVSPIGWHLEPAGFTELALPLSPDELQDAALSVAIDMRKTERR